MPYDNVGLLNAVARIRTRKGFPEREDPSVTTSRSADGAVMTTRRGEQPITVYHVQYGQDGKVIDWHLDTWKIGLEGLRDKLDRTYGVGTVGEGRPCWLLELPADATKPEEVISCDHPSCPVKFRTQEQKVIHLRAHHREFYQMQQDRLAREATDEQTTLLREQIESQNRLIKELLGERAKVKV